MKDLRKLFYLLLIIPILFVQTGCSDDDDPVDPVVVNEAEVLVKYLEANGDPVNTFAQMTTSDVVNSAVLAKDANTYIIDIRGSAKFAEGHIEGAHDVAATDVLTHYETNNLKNKDLVVIVCFSGQTAGWVTSLLHTMGYTNVKDMKWGMCSWNSATSGSWTGTNVNNSRASEFVTTVTNKPTAGTLSKLETGKTEATDILRTRVEAVFAEGFGKAKVSSDGVYSNLSEYHIINYWNQTDYSWGHIDGAMQYTPGSSLNLDADLKTIPTDKKVAVYCYTGQTSAHVAAYLRVLGYDAYSIVYGVNGMAHDTMPSHKFITDTQVKDYPLVQ